MVRTDQKEPMGCVYGMNRAEGTGSHEYRGQEVQIQIVDREFSPKELKVKVPVHREVTGGILSHFGALSFCSSQAFNGLDKARPDQDRRSTPYHQLQCLP